MKKKSPLREKVVALRKAGKSFVDIQKEIGTVSKSTLSFWLRGVNLPEHVVVQKRQEAIQHLQRIRILAAQKKQHQRLLFHVEQLNANKHLSKMLKNKETARIALAVLYMCEGTKSQSRSGSVVFGSSDFAGMKFFMHLMRFCFAIDETKFRCTIQCRADQDVQYLEDYWSHVTGVPRTQFYPARIDKRSIGKATADAGYKGVCRIDYLSVRVFEEIVLIGKLLTKGL